MARVWWPNLALDVKRFVAGCAICYCTKDMNMRLAGLLQPFPVPSGKFEYCTLDFMTDLPEVNGYNALLVIMDKFGKLYS